MSIGSISFWQQNQNFWARAQQEDQAQAQSAALINVMGNAMTTLSNGLASIANQTALDRTNTELSAAVQNALQPGSDNSSSISSSTSSTSNASTGSSSSSTVNLFGSPAIGTGTAPLTTSTSLFTLGFLANGAITVSDGTYTTTYKSTGTDTVGDLINALNANVAGHATVAAGLNSRGELVISGIGDTATVTVGGVYASNVGFGTGNNTFQPTAPSPASSSATSASSSSNSPTGSSSSASSATYASSGLAKNSALALQTGGTAEILLASSGSAGNILNMLA